ncbi:MAG: NAD(P)/FAD-dependent oxidoreductase, partial [Leeuwenhoekiella sp.]
GHWFNSAKFFDIEYQTYGWVSSSRSLNENEGHFHWKHIDDTKCITIAYDNNSGTFLGINTFGIRMRHEVIDRWLTEKRDINFVIDHLVQANFDPEFFKKHFKEIHNAYQRQLQTA